MEDSLRTINTRPPTQLRRVEPANDLADIPSAAFPGDPVVPLPFPVNYYGTTYTEVRIALVPGLIAFGQRPIPYEFYLEPSEGYGAAPVIAPFFMYQNSQLDGYDGPGRITYGTTVFEGRPAFWVYWSQVQPVDGGPLSDALATFQLLLVDRSDTGAPGDFDIVFNYATIGWDMFNFSCSGGPTLGVGAGFAAGSAEPDAQYWLPGSGVSGAFLDLMCLGQQHQ